MANTANASVVHKVRLPFSAVRNISAPEDTVSGRKVYAGQTKISNVLLIPTDENVRDYLVEAEGRQRRRPSQVHRAIQDTLVNNPSNFTVLNSGVTLVARECELDEKEKVLTLTNPSIINGSQTQGVIKDFLERYSSVAGSEDEPHVKFELIVTTDDTLIAEISIARNFQNDVQILSIVGRLGHLDELDARLQQHDPTLKLQKSETKLSDDYVRTERLLQVITVLIPEELWPKGKEFNKVYAYNAKTKCLKDFQDTYKAAKDPKHPEHNAHSALYEFMLDIAPQALELYDTWKKHPGFQGSGLRSIERDGGEIVDVPDGIIFPILGSLSNFVRKTDNGWVIKAPAKFDDRDLIKAAKSSYQTVAHSKPMEMGKSKICYSQLYVITAIYKKLLS